MSRHVPLAVEIGGVRFVSDAVLSDGPDARVHRGWADTGERRAAVLIVYRLPRDVHAVRDAMEAASLGGVAAPDVFAACTADTSPLAAAAMVIERVEARPAPLVRGSFPELGALHARLHALEAPASLPSTESPASVLERWRALGLEPPARLVAAADALAASAPPSRLLHGDFHNRNVLLAEHGPVVIDWSMASAGDPLRDVARTLLLPEIAAALFRPLALARRAVERRARGYLDGYRATADSFDAERLGRWKIVVAAGAACDAHANAISGQAGRSVRRERAVAQRLLRLVEELA